MRILFIRDFFDYGGASKMIVSVATAMSNYGHESYVYAYGSELCPIEIPDRVQFVKGTPYINNRVFRHPAKIGEIRTKIKEIDPDLIVTFMPYPSILTILAKIGLHIPIVISERGDPAIYGGFIKHIGHKIISTANGAVFQTEGAREFYKGKLYNKSIVIPNAVTIKKKERIPLEKRSNEIAFVGRFFNRQKRQDLMVSAFEQIANEFPDIDLVFYGDGQDQKMIEKMVRDKGLDTRVRFAGSVSPIEDYIKFSRMYVLASDYEGIPNSLIEAMCVGLPCVATDCTPGGARLLIKDRINGLLVPRDNVKALKNACCKILGDVEWSEKIGLAAQNVCDEFAPERIYYSWNLYLNNIVNGKLNQ